MSDIKQNTPDCYYHAASEWEQKLISTQEFFSKCLSHLGPTDSRIRHPEDADLVDKQASRLSWKGKFGPVAAAIKLCERDNLAESIDAEGLVPLFVACTVASQDIELILAADNQNVLASPLFRQALIVTALQSGNEALARDVINHTPANPPPPETCLFRMRGSSLQDADDISAGMWVALIEKGWALPSRGHDMKAAASPNGPDGVALLKTIIAAGWDMHANPLFKESFPTMALVHGEPEVLEYLFNLCSVTPTNDMLIKAIELRKTGGVGNLRWLLDKYHLDVNYVRQGGSPYNRRPPISDPRERAEWDWARRQAGPVAEPKTALHAAEIRGNTEAYEFLLSRGASKTAGIEER
ncbi:hypothetical protein F4805DRAFT_448821 [Annulohypoxylon moriforme]|nr:hypothetical protein F4805DRAFT_448821 [Annulohypoxylon moriforme]